MLMWPAHEITNELEEVITMPHRKQSSKKTGNSLDDKTLAWSVYGMIHIAAFSGRERGTPSPFLNPNPTSPITGSALRPV